MSAARSIRQFLLSLVALLGLLAAACPVRAAWAFTEFGPWPGEIKLATRGPEPRLHYRRPTTISPNDGRAWSRLCTLTCAEPGGPIYFASGLDSRIYQLVHGRERLVFDAAGLAKPAPQIRCVRMVPGNPYLYFTTVPTPQDGAPLSNGTIYALNLERGQVDFSIPVAQADVGRDWWGAFLPDDSSEGGFFLASRGDLYYLPRDRSAPRQFFHSEQPLATVVKKRNASGTSYLLYGTSAGTLRELDLKSLKHRQVVQLPTQDLADVAVVVSRPAAPVPIQPVGVQPTGEFVERPAVVKRPVYVPRAVPPTLPVKPKVRVQEIQVRQQQ